MFEPLFLLCRKLLRAGGVGACGGGEDGSQGAASRSTLPRYPSARFSSLAKALKYADVVSSLFIRYKN